MMQVIFDPTVLPVTFSDPLIQGRWTWYQTCVNSTVSACRDQLLLLTWLFIYLIHSFVQRQYRAAIRAFGCLWVTLPHIWDRHWAQYPDAFAVSVGCVRMSLTTHWNGAQAIWETCLSHVNCVDETREDGVCHTLNWSMWQQPSLYSDCRDQLVALVKHSNGTIIKAGTQNKNVIFQ